MDWLNYKSQNNSSWTPFTIIQLKLLISRIHTHKVKKTNTDGGRNFKITLLFTNWNIDNLSRWKLVSYIGYWANWNWNIWWLVCIVYVFMRQYLGACDTAYIYIKCDVHILQTTFWFVFRLWGKLGTMLKYLHRVIFRMIIYCLSALIALKISYIDI